MKMQKHLLIGLLILAVSSTSVMAVEGGNPRKGKYLFKKNCKTCHVEGAEGGNLTPLEKTMSQWERYFKKKKHNPDSWSELTEQELLDINQFLFDHAVDSDQPETCG